jgi:polyhydroxybutyrate depolymerase
VAVVGGLGAVGAVPVVGDVLAQEPGFLGGAVEDHPGTIYGAGAGFRGVRPRTRVRLPLVAAALPVLLGSCGGVTSSSSTATAAPPVAARSTRAGCGSTTGSATLAPTIGGRTRTVIVRVPTGYTGATQVPLVLNMHGSGATAAGQEAFSGMDATAESRGFIVAYPQGIIPDGTGFDWNVPGVPLVGGRAVPAGAPDDVAFLTTLVTTLEHRYCIDASRVYATGFSGGARMASQLGCDASTVFAAVAPVSGLRYPSPCPATRHVPVIAFHGTADPVDPDGGNGQAYWTYSVPQAARGWAVQDGCATAPITSQPTPGVTRTVYSGCGGGGTDVELDSIDGEGHEWPGGPPLPTALTRVLGPQSSAIDANGTMWAFFAAHPLP